MNIIVETERLILRTFTMDDAILIYELNQDPAVTRYTFDPVNDIDQAREVLAKTILPQYALYNHGRWAVHLKNGLEFIGWCGLKTRPGSHGEGYEIDLGYRFRKECWGKGYATEAAHACLKYGFERQDLPRIVGRAVVGNEASLKVLEKCGMVYIGKEMIEGYLHKTYEALNPFIP